MRLAITIVTFTGLYFLFKYPNKCMEAVEWIDEKIKQFVTWFLK